MKALLENNITENTVKDRVELYDWPYSQPPILNVVKATSKLGFTLGLFTIPLVFQPMYVFKGIFNIDLSLIISFIILRMIIVPRVRRALIRQVASVSRTFNRAVLIVSTLLMYSAMIRLVTAIGLLAYNHNLSFEVIWGIISKRMYLHVIILASLFIVLPTLAILYPKDVSVIKFHYSLRFAHEKNKKPVGISQTNYDYAFDSSMPLLSKSYNVQFPTAKEDKPMQAETAKTAQQTPNKQQKTATKPSAPKAETKKRSVWDADKSIRRPR